MMTESNKPLSDVLYAFALAMPVPDARTLDEFVRRYPEHADALTEFAVELALEPDRAEEEEEETAPSTDAVSPAVSRAISHFHNVAFELEQTAGGGTAAAAVTNPLSGLSRDEFRDFASRLGVNSTFAIKLRDRLIEPDSIFARPGFYNAAADAARVPLDVMMAHLRAPSAISARAYYKAGGKPGVTAKESFEDAVRRSGLTEEQQRRLLSL
jgi:hypothetical protein